LKSLYYDAWSEKHQIITACKDKRKEIVIMLLPIETRARLIEMNNCKRPERKGIIWLKA